jgi:polysaccharide pyruvyl transferase WcaK-like protein
MVGHKPDSGEPIYQGYIEKLKDFVLWLLDQGYFIRLLTGNLGVDQRPVDDLLQFVKEEGQARWQDRIIAEAIANTDELLYQISKTDIVVASRFHNVLCALMLGRPVVSIGYHIKNESLMAEMGLQDYCQHIEHFTVKKLIQQFQLLISDMNQVSGRILDKNAQYRQELDQQYRKILLS